MNQIERYDSLKEALNNVQQIPTGRAKDLSGQTFGKLKPLFRVYSTDTRNAKWLCKCDCGNYVCVLARCLPNGNTISCGCAHCKTTKVDGWTQVKMTTEIDTNEERIRYWLNDKCQSCKKCSAYKCLKKCGRNRLSSNLPWCQTLSQKHLNYLNYLIDNNINYEMEYWFDDLRLTNPLRFDFAIMDNQNNLLKLIEIQGEQHYQKMGYKDADKKIELQKKRDELKREYCKNHNIILEYI